MRRKSHQEFIDELKRINPVITVLESYVNCSTKINVQCLECNHIWTTVPNSLIQGHGCPVCAKNQKKQLSQFVEEMHFINPYIEIVGEYKNAITPILVRCTICKNEWYCKPNRLLNGVRCPNCVKPHTSFMEQFMLIAFRNAIGKSSVESRNTSAIGMELDIYIPNYKLAIEPGTWFYHERKVEKQDYIKREKCKKAGIRIITIYDCCPPGTEPPYEKDCYVYEGFLNEPGYERMIRLIQELMHSIGISSENMDWDVIANQSYAACHYNAHEDFVKKLAHKFPNIEVLEEYKGSNIPIKVNDRTCIHSVWKARPDTLLRGIGCPECGRITAAKTRTRTPQEFVNEMLQITPSVEITGEYTKVTDRIEVCCKICGHTWKPLAYSLLSGKGCPHCSAVQGAKQRKNNLKVKTTQQFKEELFGVNPQIKVIGEYINNKTKISAECMVCGHKWNVVPASLLNGHGCPNCARKHSAALQRKK